MELRSYQAQAIYSARAALAHAQAHGKRRSVLLVAPTGAGKTRIAAEIIRLAVERGKRTLFLAHRTELIDQAYDALARLGLSVGVIAASSNKTVNPYRPVQVASIDTLNAREIRPISDLVIEDEAHHGAATTHRALLDHYRGATLVGLTATPERSDGSGLGGDLFSELVVVATPAELLEQGHLVPMEIVRPAAPLRPGKIAQRPVDAWRQHAAGRQTIVFCASVEHADRVSGEFAMDNVDTAVVSAETPHHTRTQSLRLFRSDDVRVLCNVAVLTEGVDLPNTSCIILARGVGTAGLYLQMAGRGSRPAPGKSNCILIDLRGVSHQLGHPYDSRTYSLDGRGIASKTEAAEQSYCRVCGAPIEPGGACTECNIGARDRSITVTGDVLVKYAAMRRLEPSAKRAWLTEWLAQARHRGYKQGWAYAKYRAVFGEAP